MLFAKTPGLVEYLVIMAGGALGSGARVWISWAVAMRFGESFPWGTILVNVSGCLAIGLFVGLTGPESPFLVAPLLRQAVALGVLGGFTTFSSFSIQTLALASDGQWFNASGNVVLSVVVCLAATWLGGMLASAFVSRF